MLWNAEIKGYLGYLRLEKGLSANTVAAYGRDIKKLALYLEEQDKKKLSSIRLEDLSAYVRAAHTAGAKARTQARSVSSIKSFFRFLLIEKLIEEDPSELLEAPKIGFKLPVTLSIEEVERILDSIDLSHPQGARDRAMIEVLYGCGLRVSELCSLLLSGLHLDQGYLRILGKGDKERITPIGGQAKKHLELYLNHDRVHRLEKKGFEDHVFLNHHGRSLSRVSIFKLVKKLSEAAGIRKNVSPHSFRHSFATHLVQGGADLRAVQEMLGHESITTTEIYSHLDREYLRSEIMAYHPLESGALRNS